MIKTIATAAVTLALSFGLGAQAHAATGHGGGAGGGGLVSQSEYDGLHQWEVKPWVEVVLHRSGHFVKAFDGAAPCAGCGTHYKVRRYPMATAGDYALVTYWHYVKPGFGDAGWVVWSKSLCDSSDVCS